MTEFGDDEIDETIDADPAALEELKRRALDPQVLAEIDAELDVTEIGDRTEIPDLNDAGLGDPAADIDAGVDATEHGDPTELEVAGPAIVAAPPQPDPTPVGAAPVDSAVADAGEGRSAAAAFLAEAREREADETAAEPAATRSKGGPSGAVLVLAVVIAAQILAGGVYFALRALADDPEPDEVVTAVDDAPIEVPTPTPRPSVDPTATPLPSPTAVPPTPSWIPAAGGPRWAPFTFVATPRTSSPTFYDAPNGEAFEPMIGDRPLTNPWPSGSPLRFRAISGDPETDWAQLALPGGDADAAWVLSADFEWSSVNRLVQIDVLTNKIRVFEANDAIFEAVIATGRRSDPTPQMQSWVVENPAGDGVADATPLLVLAPAAGTDGLRIVPASDESVLGDYVTDGDVLIAESEARQLARIIQAGAKVEVIGLPAVPTPTPRPTPTANASGDGPAAPQPPSAPGCPRGALGAPPDCYQVVARESLPGVCERNGILIQGSCLLLYGNPDFDGRTTQCPPQASRQIEDRCYASLGPPPPRVGDCPPDANEVAGECRVPVP